MASLSLAAPSLFDPFLLPTISSQELFTLLYPCGLSPDASHSSGKWQDLPERDYGEIPTDTGIFHICLFPGHHS